METLIAQVNKDDERLASGPQPPPRVVRTAQGSGSPLVAFRRQQRVASPPSGWHHIIHQASPQQATAFSGPVGGPAAPPSAAGHNSAGVVVRKPRTRGLRQLLCCLGLSVRRRRSPSRHDRSSARGPSAGAFDCPDQDQNGAYVPRSSEKLLLPPIRATDAHKNCLIIDLDETLVHSSFKPVKNPDFIIPVEIDGVVHQVYVLKRPFVDEFLQRIGQLFECVLFTASLAKYADPVADLLDRWGVFRARLFREACVFHKGNYVKDLNRLGRDLKRVIIIDNSPASYSFHPDNAIPVQSWFDDLADTELLDLVPFLERLAHSDNVLQLLSNCNEPVVIAGQMNSSSFASPLPFGAGSPPSSALFYSSPEVLSR